MSEIRGAVELLQDDEIAPDQRRRLLGNIAGNARRLSALVARLLELARADVALHKPDFRSMCALRWPLRMVQSSMLVKFRSQAKS
ncbi:histidine kinase dimerization/phospho-acceptor domain-containing protein [Brevundimonas sp.]|uniref:histidine kinase dimerization/phospho-acceptor domain-containing protein n=1 Tax=Brevundimonas sp. TaxID=1871086 RepID=UPI003D10067D